jgi:EAL and modified HD-GYP domain-containing signal transduction protein
MDQATFSVHDRFAGSDCAEAARGTYQMGFSDSGPGAMDFLVGRQPILNHRGKTVAYELLFRSSADNRCAETDGAMATKKVIRNSFLTIGSDRVLASKPGFINFPRELLVDRSALCLNSDHVVIEILEDVEPDTEVLEACIQLEEAGYRIALDDIIETNAFSPLLPYADYAKIDVQA